jgi:hypothetical protein
MSRRHPKRKTSAGRFAMLPLALLQHIAVITLTHAAFRVLVLLAAAYNGKNNGAIGITAEQAIEVGIGCRNTYYRALRDLQDRRLIVPTYPASRVPPRPTMWTLSWQPVNETNYSAATSTPSHAYRDWQPSRKAA